MITAHDIIAFIEYEMYFQSVQDAEAAKRHAAAAAPQPGRPSGPNRPNGVRYHRPSDDDDPAGRVRSDRVT